MGCGEMILYCDAFELWNIAHVAGKGDSRHERLLRTFFSNDLATKLRISRFAYTNALKCTGTACKRLEPNVAS